MLRKKNFAHRDDGAQPGIEKRNLVVTLFGEGTHERVEAPLPFAVARLNANSGLVRPQSVCLVQYEVDPENIIFAERVIQTTEGRRERL